MNSILKKIQLKNSLASKEKSQAPKVNSLIPSSLPLAVFTGLLIHLEQPCQEEKIETNLYSKYNDSN